MRHGVYANITDGRVGSYIYKMTDKDTDKSIVVVCNFDKENEITLDMEGKCILSNYEKRAQAGGTYKVYECAVFEV